MYDEILFIPILPPLFLWPQIQCVVETCSKQHRQELKAELLDKYGSQLIEWGTKKLEPLAIVPSAATSRGGSSNSS